MGIKLPIVKKIKAWMLGFTSISYLVYDLENNESKYYLNDINREFYTGFINGREGKCFRNKMEFNKKISTLSNIKTPKQFAYINNGEITILEQNQNNNTNLTIYIDSLLIEYVSILLKPNYGDGGEGIEILKKANTGYQPID